MKIKLLEHFQDSSVHFSPGQEVEVDDALGAYLLEHRKAVKVEPQTRQAKHLDVEPQFEQAEEPQHYGGQAEAELRNDDKKSQTVEKPRRGRRSK
jgi:hypothetical protein